jgi:hypothetical protein
MVSLPSLRPEKAGKFIEGDTVDPAGKKRVPPEHGHTGVKAEENELGDVFGVVQISGPG